MAFAKKYRLKTRDVIFLTKKKQFYSCGYFGFFYFFQNNAIKYNQISSHITIKYSKKATERNFLKRILNDILIQNSIINLDFDGRFLKIFIILNKIKLDELKKQIENNDKKSIVNFIETEFKNSFYYFKKKLHECDKKF